MTHRHVVLINLVPAQWMQFVFIIFRECGVIIFSVPSVCLSVYRSVCLVGAVTFECFDIQTSFLVRRYIMVMSRAGFSIKVTGSSSRWYERNYSVKHTRRWSRGVFHSRLKTPYLKVFPSIAVYPFWSPGIMTTRCLAVTGGGSIAKCGRLSQPSWLLARTIT